MRARAAHKIRDNYAVAVLVTVAAIAAVPLIVALATVGSNTLWLEAGKGLIQLIVIGVMGTALKLVADAYQERRQRLEQRNEFRQETYNRLVDGTNTLRKAQLLIKANRSVKTWSEQMLQVIDAGLTLRRIKHDVYSSRFAPDPPFPRWWELVYLLEQMYGYVELLGEDYSKHKKTLSERQRAAEAEELTAEGRARAQGGVWREIRSLESAKDLLAEVTDQERRKREQEVEEELIRLPLATVTSKPAQLSWVRYEALETLALDLITQAALATSGESNPSRRP